MDDEIYLFGKGLRTDLPTDLHRIAIGNGIDEDQNVLWPVFLNWVLGQNIDADTLNGFSFEELQDLWQAYADSKDVAINSNTSRIVNLENNQTIGYEVYSNYQDRSDGRSFLPPVGVENVSYKVADDAVDSSLNGFYRYENGAYEPDSSLANGVVEEGDSEAINGDTAFKANSSISKIDSRVFDYSSNLKLPIASTNTNNEFIRAFKALYIEGSDKSLTHFISFLRVLPNDPVYSINISRIESGGSTVAVCSGNSTDDLSNGYVKFKLSEVSGSGITATVLINFSLLNADINESPGSTLLVLDPICHESYMGNQVYLYDNKVTPEEIVEPSNQTSPVAGNAVVKLNSPFSNTSIFYDSQYPNNEDEENIISAFKACYLDGIDITKKYRIRTLDGINKSLQIRDESDNLIASSSQPDDFDPTTVQVLNLSGTGVTGFIVVDFSLLQEISSVSLKEDFWKFDNDKVTGFQAFNKCMSYKIELYTILRKTNSNLDTFLKALFNGYVRITVVGTSITFGADLAEREYTWPNMLRKELEKTFPNVEFEVINYGITSRRLEDYVNDDFTAENPPSGDQREDFWVTSTLDNWQIPPIEGVSWKQLTQDTAPDMFIIHHGANDAGYSTVQFQQWLIEAMEDALTWDKKPSLVLCPEILATEDPGESFVAANKFVKKYARTMRNLALNYGAAVIDFNRNWILLRDGLDEDVVEFYKQYPSTFQLTEGSPLVTQTDTEIESDQLDTSVISTDGERFLEGTFRFDYLCNTGSIAVVGVGQGDGNNNFFKWLSVVTTTSAVQIWESTSDLVFSFNFPFIVGTTYEMYIQIKEYYIRVWINKTKYVDYKIPTNISEGNVIIGVRNTLLSNIHIEGGRLSQVQDAKYPEIPAGTNPLLGGTTDEGGNGLNHPSRIGIYEAFLPAIRNFINKYLA